MLVAKRNQQADESRSFFPSDRWNVSMSTAHASYPSSKLLTDNLDDAAMAWGQRQSHTTIKVVTPYTLPVDTPLDYVAVLGLNRNARTVPQGILGDTSFSTNQARLIVDTESPDSTIEPAVQLTGFVLTNLTGTYDILNQVINPPEMDLVGGYSPSALVKVSDSLDTEVRFQYSIFKTLSTGVNSQVLYVHVRDSVDITVLPTIVVTLRQGGVDIATLTRDYIEKTTQGYIYRYRWNAALLPIQSATTVAFRIDGIKTASSTVEFIAVKWWAGISDLLFDSGWTTQEFTNKVVWTPDLLLPNSNYIFITVQFTDFAYTVAETVSGQTVHVYHPFNDGFTAGRFLAGHSLNAPLRDMRLRKIGAHGAHYTVSYGGQFRANRRDLTRWEADLAIIPQSQTRMFAELDEFFADVGFILPSLYIPTDGVIDPTHIFNDSLWSIISMYENVDLGLLIGNDTSTSPPYTQDKRFDLRMTIIEANAKLTPSE